VLHVAAHRQAAHVVGVVEVVFDVELVEVERGDEGGVFGGQEGGAEEGEDDVWPFGGGGVSGWVGGGGWVVWGLGRRVSVRRGGRGRTDR